MRMLTAYRGGIVRSKSHLPGLYTNGLARADRFNVTLPFLLQKAAWLYDRQMSSVRAQLRKASKPSSKSSSPTPGAEHGSGTVGGHPMSRGGSNGIRLMSSLSIVQNAHSRHQTPERGNLCLNATKTDLYLVVMHRMQQLKSH